MVFAVVVYNAGGFLFYKKHINQYESEFVLKRALPWLNYAKYEYKETGGGLNSRPIIIYKIEMNNEQYIEWKSKITSDIVKDPDEILGDYSDAWLNYVFYNEMFGFTIKKGDRVYRSSATSGFATKDGVKYIIYAKLIYWGDAVFFLVDGRAFG